MTALNGLSGPFVSLAGRLAAQRHGPDEPSVGQVFCRDVTHAQVLGSRTALEEGAGRDTAFGAASNAALGEAFERYGLRDLDKTRTITASETELAARGRPYILPAELAPDLGAGHTLRPPPAAYTAIRWLASADLVTGEEVLLPAQYCIYVEPPCADRSCSACGTEGREDPWCMATSNGAAAGRSPAATCLSGLLELVERDAFMLMWYHRLRLPYLRIDPHSLLGQRVSRMLGTPRIDVRFIDLTEVHDVPVVVGVARGRLGGREVHSFGAGSALDLPTAVWKAATELATIYQVARRNVAADVPTPDEVTTFDDHLRYYRDPAHHHELDFLFEDRPWASVPVRWPVPPTSPADELLHLSHQLRERHIRTYAVDLTPDHSPPGLFCYKVVSPELIPLDCDHRARYVNKERLFSEPARRGWRPGRPELEELNHAPHPLP